MNDAAPELLRIDDGDRFESLRLIPWWDQERLSRTRILVVGAGALGNEAIKNLALLGVGHLAVVDMDTVESSNLSRSVLFRASDAGRRKAEVAAERAAEINPQIQITPLASDVLSGVGLGWFADADIVLGCLDNREARLWVNRCCWHVGTPWIDAGIQEISGVVQVFVPPDGTCYECGMKQADYRLINLRYSCPLLRQEDVRRGRVPTTPTIASIMAGWQVQEALKLVHAQSTSASSAMVFHGMTNHVYRTNLPRHEACLSHDPWDPAERLPEVTAESTAAELFAAAARAVNDAPLRLRLHRDLVRGFACGGCGHEQTLLQGLLATRASEAVCPSCGATMTAEIVGDVATSAAELSEKKLSELGIPAADIVTLEFAAGPRRFRLADPTFAPTGSLPGAPSEEAASRSGEAEP
ncbi:ThiF family adenylyltransferase [Candidatus Laterigemmans baculatus]|uniref:ThiF family adenylyltransferase n=1 Tax=Candidatus Laterigemmans baculatus TaxID=2770505 RepID=UPI0013DC7ED9|nr:ThiF family adenylyltransferase [Candidatus Laterigemmans baculatus]